MEPIKLDDGAEFGGKTMGGETGGRMTCSDPDEDL